MQSSETTIRETFTQWTDAWNNGDLESHLLCYAHGDDVVYISGKIIRGHAAILEHFRKRFPTTDNMGKLTIKSLEINLIGENVARLIGTFEHEINNTVSNGVFTLHLRQIDGQWRIVVDHSSALA